MPWGSGAAATAAEALRAGHQDPDRRRRLHARRTQVRDRHRVRPPGRQSRRHGRDAAADRAAPRRRARADQRRPGPTKASRSAAAARRALKAPRVLLAWDAPVVDALGRLGALRPRAALRPARHRDAHVDAAELRHEGLRRPGAAVGQLHLQRRRAAAAEGLDPQRRHADHDRRSVALGGARSRRTAVDRHAAARRLARAGRARGRRAGRRRRRRARSRT